MAAVGAIARLSDRGLLLEQALLELLVAGLKWAALGAHFAVLAVAAIAVALQVCAVEEVGLVAEAAGHPLPAEVVAGRVPIEQVAQEPLGAGLPADPPPVHDIRRQPHPGVVVEPAGLVQLLDESIHAGQAGLTVG